MNIIRANITVYDSGIPGTKILRYATKGHTTKPTDTPPNTYYAPLIVDPGSYEQMMFAAGTTSGPSSVGHGNLVLKNDNGGLNPLMDYGLDGRAITIEEVNGATFAILEAHTLTMEQPIFENDEVTIILKDRQSELDTPLQQNKYGGTNPLPNGIDGSVDLKDQEKNLMYGPVVNATPQCVNTAKQIYRANDGAIVAGSGKVRDMGVLLKAGTDYTSQADMEANPPAPFMARWWPAGGLFRLGYSPLGALTYDAIEGTTSADRTAAQIVKRMLLRNPNFSASDLVDADLEFLDLWRPEEIRFPPTPGITTKDAIAQVLDSVAAWSGFDINGKFRIGCFNAPLGLTEPLTIKNIKNIERIQSSDEGKGVPSYSTVINYDRNPTVQTDGLTGQLTMQGWVNQPSIPAQAWHAIAFGNGLFVAIAPYTNVYATSPDGENWTGRTLPRTEKWISITYGNGLFVILAGTWSSTGYYSRIYTSPDGVTWTERTCPVDQNWSQCIYANGLFIATSGSTLDYLTSPDGITWTARTFPAGGTTFRTGIAYGNGIFVVTGYGSGTYNLYTSTDGINWTGRTMPNVGTYGYAVTFGNAMFVAVADSNISLTSPDGINWTQRVLPSTATWFNVAFGDGIFMATAGYDKMTATSPDGITWTQLSIPSNDYWYGLAYGNGAFVALANNGAQQAMVYHYNTPSAWATWVAKEYRSSKVNDDNVKLIHLTSPVLTFNTLLTNEADAQTIGYTRRDFYRVRRDFLKITCDRLEVPNLPVIGGELDLFYPLYGYANGKLFIIMGFERDLENNDIIIYLWG